MQPTIRFAIAWLLVLSLVGCSAVTTPVPTSIPTAAVSMTATFSPVATPSPTPPSEVTLYWLSFSTNEEPHSRLLYEGGSDVTFTDVRLVAPDGTIVAQAAAAPTANEVMQMCGKTYGPLRVTLAVPTQSVLSDVRNRPDAYRVDVRITGVWKRAALVNVCHVQV